VQVRVIENDEKTIAIAKSGDWLPAPSIMIFGWHGTLVDTHDAMLSAMEEMLPS